MTNTKNTPIEALEREFPMRVLRYRPRRGSGGGGYSPGGEGIERDVLMLEDVTVSLVAERRVSQPLGAGGWFAGRGGGELATASGRRGARRAATATMHSEVACRRCLEDAHTRRWLGNASHRCRDVIGTTPRLVGR